MQEYKVIRQLQAFTAAKHRAKMLFKALRITTGITREQLIRKGNHRDSSDARSIYVYLMLEDLSIDKELIMQFVNRDRTTLYHNKRKAEALSKTDRAYSLLLDNTRNTLNQLLIQNPIKAAKLSEYAY